MLIIILNYLICVNKNIKKVRKKNTSNGEFLEILLMKFFKFNYKNIFKRN